MRDDGLESELDQGGQHELAAARIEYASLGARIAGLQARHAALSKAVSGAGQRSQPSAQRSSGVSDRRDRRNPGCGWRARCPSTTLLAALRQAGRGHETCNNVGVDLAYLAERGRITRVRRGIYASVSG